MIPTENALAGELLSPQRLHSLFWEIDVVNRFEHNMFTTIILPLYQYS